MCGLLFAEARDWQTGRYIFKPIASATFVAVAIAGGHGWSAYGIWIVVALAFSFIGDLLLIPKSDAIFQAGIVAFALAHIAFILAFFAHGMNVPDLLLALVPLAIVGFLIARALVPRVDAVLRPAVIGYAVILTVMLACANGAFRASATSGYNGVVLFAAVLFYLSDLSVARDKFVKEAFDNRLIGLPLYYAAQLLFALSVAPPNG